MKISRILVLGLLALSACSSGKEKKPAVAEGGGGGGGDTETMLLTYHVIQGKETELAALLARGWETYQREKLVAPSPHMRLSGVEDGGKTKYVEIFTWVSRTAPDNAPPNVKQIWAEEEALCETRNGHGGIEGGEMTIMTRK